MATILQYAAAVETVQQLPPSTLISVQYLEDGNRTATMPMASTCIPALYFPVVHEDYDSFQTTFTMALEFGLGGFGVI